MSISQSIIIIIVVATFLYLAWHCCAFVTAQHTTLKPLNRPSPRQDMTLFHSSHNRPRFRTQEDAVSYFHFFCPTLPVSEFRLMFRLSVIVANSLIGFSWDSPLSLTHSRNGRDEWQSSTFCLVDKAIN